jgi:hypothetical protein
VIEGAHTAGSVEHAVHTFTALYGTGGICVFGCAAGKNVESMARATLPCFSHVIITAPGSFKVSHPEAFYAGNGPGCCVCGVVSQGTLDAGFGNRFKLSRGGDTEGICLVSG